MDACPGRLNQISLYIDRVGVFYGQCSEICGELHGFMPIVVESIPLPEESECSEDQKDLNQDLKEGSLDSSFVEESKLADQTLVNESTISSMWSSRRDLKL